VQSPESAEAKILFAGQGARYVPTGHLIYGLDGVLLAVPFDPRTLDVVGVGGPVRLVEGVRWELRGPQYAVSDSGVLAYVPSTGPSAVGDGVLT
jgi:hypothetical protein